jgi:hypothetical protein
VSAGVAAALVLIPAAPPVKILFLTQALDRARRGVVALAVLTAVG